MRHAPQSDGHKHIGSGKREVGCWGGRDFDCKNAGLLLSKFCHLLPPSLERCRPTQKSCLLMRCETDLSSDALLGEKSAPPQDLHLAAADCISLGFVTILRQVLGLNVSQPPALSQRICRDSTPIGPTGPSGPGLPSSPCGPRGPLGPRIPCGPGGPYRPCGPCTP